MDDIDTLIPETDNLIMKDNDTNADSCLDNCLVRVNIRISKSLDSAIRTIAAETGISRSAVMRILMNEHMSEYLNTLIYVDGTQGDEIKTLLINVLGAMSDLTFQTRKLGVNVNQIARHLNSEARNKTETYDLTEIFENYDSMHRADDLNINYEDIELIRTLIDRADSLVEELGGVLWPTLISPR